MAVELSNHRWVVAPNQFAARVTISDVKGTFSGSVIVEPGTRALVIEDGYYAGEIPPGEYTLQSFSDKLKFWRKKQSTVILTRMEHQSIAFRFDGIPTRENLSVNAKLRLVVQMADVDAFLHNLLGPRTEYTTEQLQHAMAPLVRQALWASIGQMSIQELTSPQAALEIGAAVYEAMNSSLTRYGLQFIEVQAVDIEHEKYDHLREKQGDVWLANLRTGQMSDELDAYRKRATVRQEIREALQKADMDKLSTKEDMRRFLEDLNKERLIRKEELDQLVAGYEERKQDRQGARQHLVRMVEISRQQELDQARIAAAFAVKSSTIEHEMLLARAAASKENEAWQRKLEKEREAAEYRRDQQLREVGAHWERARESNRQRRDDQWEGLVHEQRMHRLQADLECSRAEQKGRTELMQMEYHARIDEQKLIADRRRKDWELEVSARESTQQMDRMRELQALNNQAADAGHQREMNKLNTIGQMGVEAWIATADSANAAALADLKKHEIMNSAAQHQLAAAKEMNDERAKLYEKLNAAERSKAEAIAEAFKASMQSQQGTVTQMISSLGMAATPRIVTQPVAVTPAGGGGATAVPAAHVAPPPMPPVAAWHVALDGQQAGPFPEPQLKQMISSGKVNANTLVWKTGLPAWTPAGQFPEFFSSTTGGTVLPPPLPQ